MIAFGFLGLITVLTYWGAPMIVVPYLQARPQQTQVLFATLETALLAYASDHGVFPPQEELNHYRRHNKNLSRSRSYGITTYHVESLRGYADVDRLGDPYAAPEQYCPPAYFTLDLSEGRYAVLSSAGPNLKYEVRLADFRNLTTLAAVRAELERHRHRPEDGPRSGGDFFRLVGPATRRGS